MPSGDCCTSASCYAVAKAPMRETMASLFLRQQIGFGTEPVVDPSVRLGNVRHRGGFEIAGERPAAGPRASFRVRATGQVLRRQGARCRARGRHDAVGRPAGRDLGRRNSHEPRQRRARGVAQASPAARRAARSKTSFGRVTARHCSFIDPPMATASGTRAIARALPARLGTLADAPRPGGVGLITNEAQLAQATGLPFAERRPGVAWRIVGHAVPDRPAAVTGNPAPDRDNAH